MSPLEAVEMGADERCVSALSFLHSVGALKAGYTPKATSMNFYQ